MKREIQNSYELIEQIALFKPRGARRTRNGVPLSDRAVQSSREFRQRRINTSGGGTRWDLIPQSKFSPRRENEKTEKLATRLIDAIRDPKAEARRQIREARKAARDRKRAARQTAQTAKKRAAKLQRRDRDAQDRPTYEPATRRLTDKPRETVKTQLGTDCDYSTVRTYAPRTATRRRPSKPKRQTAKQRREARREARKVARMSYVERSRYQRRALRNSAPHITEWEHANLYQRH